MDFFLTDGGSRGLLSPPAELSNTSGLYLFKTEAEPGPLTKKIKKNVGFHSNSVHPIHTNQISCYDRERSPYVIQMRVQRIS